MNNKEIESWKEFQREHRDHEEYPIRQSRYHFVHYEVRPTGIGENIMAVCDTCKARHKSKDVYSHDITDYDVW